jgi:hypothetical protein
MHFPQADQAPDKSIERRSNHSDRDIQDEQDKRHLEFMVYILHILSIPVDGFSRMPAHWPQLE